MFSFNVATTRLPCLIDSCRDSGGLGF